MASSFRKIKLFSIIIKFSKKFLIVNQLFRIKNIKLAIFVKYINDWLWQNHPQAR
jgi:hypothetical protein